MGATESTARPNGTQEEDGDGRGPPNNTRGGNSGAAAVAGAAVGIAFAAWGISKLMSTNDSDTQQIRSAQTKQPSFVTLEGSGYRENQLPLTIWSPPSPGRYKMNTDGSCPDPLPSPDDGVKRGPSGVGGLLRDHNGKWVGGFRQFIGVTDPLTSEFLAILKGLQLLDELKIRRAVLETDCKPAWEWVINQRGVGRRTSAIVRECWDVIESCRGLIEKNKVEVSHVDREGNRCADKLARMAIERKETKYLEIKDLPYELISLVANDAKNVIGN